MKRYMNKKSAGLLLCGTLLFCTTIFSGCKQKQEEVIEPTPLEGEELSLTNFFDSQKTIDDNLRKELANDHTFEAPFVVVDPYGNSPLTALVIFTTKDETKITLTVKSKNSEDDITTTFERATEHMIPVYGLYANGKTNVILTMETGETKELEIKTDTLPTNPGTIEVTMKQEENYNYKQFTFVSSSSGYIYAYDSKGDIRWYRAGLGMPFKQLKNGHVMYCSPTNLTGFYYMAGLVETDLLGRVYHEYLIPGGVHHDFYEMENGNLLVASDSQDFSSVEDCIVEIDRATGDVVYQLDMKDLLNKEDGGSINRSDADWFHNNGIWYDEESDIILLSARHVDAVVGIDKSKKKLAFILGDPDGWTNVDKSLFFTPIGDNFEWQYAQHQVSIRPDGTIMMFDNGAGRTKSTKLDKQVTGDDVYSRAVAYKVDRTNMTIEQVFEYGKEIGKDWYSEWISGAICLNGDSNDIWITSGSHLTNTETGCCDYGPGDMFQKGLVQSSIMTEVKNGEVVFIAKAPSLSYRSIRIPMYSDTREFAIESEGKYIGDLGPTKLATQEIDLDTLEKAEMDENWTLLYTPIRFSLTGTYQLEQGVEEAPKGYIVLKNQEETRFYDIKQNVTASEDASIVSINGWLTSVGLEGKSYQILVVIGEKLYETGNIIVFP